MRGNRLTLFLLTSTALVIVGLNYSTAAFDCSLPGVYGAECADAARAKIKPVLILITMAWCISLWLLIRKRKTQ